MLVFVLVLELLQTIVKLLSSLTIQVRRIRLKTPEQSLSFFEKLARGSAGLSLSGFCSGGYPDSKGSQTVGPLKPGLQDGQAGEVRMPPRRNLVGNLQELL